MQNIRTIVPGLVMALFLGTTIMALPVAAQSANSAGDRGSEPDAAMVSYDVSVDIKAEIFKVGGVLRNIPGDTITFHFPIWGPGAYDIVNFGSYVRNFTAMSSTGQQLTVVRSDTNTFKIIGGDAGVRVSYDVDDIESAPTSLWFGLSDIEKDFAFANTPAIFGYPDGYKNVRYLVNYNVPKGWDIAMGLDPAGPVTGASPRNGGAYLYTARDYDELVDAPLSMGEFQMLEFEEGGKPHIIAIHSPVKLTSEGSKDLVNMTRKIVKIVSDVFGELPYDRYIFQHYLVQPAPGDYIFGALEHRNSSSYRMPAPGGFSGESAAEILKGVIAHEYWHLWSPKRIHVSELGPFDYQRGPRTNSLWFAEGLTEYYAQVLLSRNGLTDPRAQISSLSQAVAMSRGKRQNRSLGELSMKIAELEPTEIFALYTKGPVVGLLMDAAIRSQTGNRKSLDDAMRYFNDQYGKTGKSFTDEEIIPIIEKATGANLKEFYDRYIVGAEPLPYDEYLPKMGIKVDVETKKKRTFGAEMEEVENGWKVISVNPGESAEKMGLHPGDVMTSINYKNSKISTTTVAPSYADAIATMRDVVGFDVIQNGEAKKLEAKIVEGMTTSAKVSLDPGASAEALAIRKAMLGL